MAVVFSSHQLDLVEDYCERVTIVAKGRIVAEGDLDELRRGGDPRLVVEVEGDKTAGWANRLQGVTVTDNASGRLAAAPRQNRRPAGGAGRARRSAGSVIEFRFEQRRLSEVFREAVANVTGWHAHSPRGEPRDPRTDPEQGLPRRRR